MSLRQNSGEVLIDYLSSLTPENMGVIAERLMEADKAFGANLLHSPDCSSVLQIINAAADGSDESELNFYTTLRTVIPAIPGQSADGVPTAMHSLYAQQPEANQPLYDVMSQARENLSSDMLDESDRNYWMGLVRKQIPELAHVENITAEMIPLSEAELNGNQITNDWNASIGEAAGKLLHSVTSGTSKQSEATEENNHSFLTDPANGQPHRDTMAAHEAIQADADTDDGFGEGGYNTVGGA